MKNKNNSGKKSGSRIRKLLLDIVIYTVGMFAYAGAVSVFTAPNNIAPGGVTGLATLIQYLFGINIGISILVLNIPIVIAGIALLGWRFAPRTAFCIVVSSTFIFLFETYLPNMTYTENPLLAAMFGGVFSGLGLALCFMRGATTGGTDIIARMVGKYKPHITQGKLILLADCVVILIAAAVYRSAEPAMYALVTIFISSVVIDAFLYGLDKGRMMMIVTDKPDEMCTAITKNFPRGATMINAEGAYSRQYRGIVICVARKSEYYKIRRTVSSTDRDAFIMVSEVTEVLGKGFKSI
ncbi:MAG: YitT family protein [Oscillospiraceae bacterium]|jgi:uncharacterized membrane-anchored protein YitT (DUF2179 family)|nr:YitT family protein [Oscillospiraceae bacterium]